MPQYNHRQIEKKWQKRWAQCKLSQVKEDHQIPKTKRRYVLDMFPYPSGSGLHVGHVEGYSASDIYARYLRMKGFHVLHPMGWDAFGLPTENYALKIKTNPKIVTQQNTAHFKKQCQMMGFFYDWSREINTSDPKYYKWTQWLFLLLYKKGLAYKKKAPVNWCQSCQTVLAREQVEGGKCERCKSQVIQKELTQWFFKITAYAERLLADFDKLDWPESIKLMQRNWIGKSEGAEIEFELGLTPQLIGGLNRDNGGLNQQSYQEQGSYYFITFPTYGRTLFFADHIKSKTILKILKNIIKQKNYHLYELVIMPDHVHILLKLKYSESLRKIIKNIKGISSKLYPDSQGHLWAKGFEYKKIDNQNDYNRVLNYIKENPRKAGLENKNRFLNQTSDCLKVFTTRPDTIFGATYLVLAPEHPVIKNFQFSIFNFQKIEEYIKRSKQKSELERTDLAKEKTGVEVKGLKAINPATGQAIPIWIADYVLMSYGTGAIMAVPAHDERDFEFARKYKLQIKQAICYNLEDYQETSKALMLLSKINQAAEQQGVKIWLLGGLACAFYAQAIYRRHCDLDLLVKNQADLKKLQSVLENLGFGQLSKKEIIYQGVKSTNLIFKDKNGAEVEIGEYGQGFEFKCEDLEYEVKYLNNFSSRVLSLKYIKKFKQYQLNNRNKEKDKIDWEFLNGKVISEEGFLINSQTNIKTPEKKSEVFKGSKLVLQSTGCHLNSNINNTKKFVNKRIISFNGMSSEEAKEKIVVLLAKDGLAKKSVQYRLRDWLISRQRYWGAPIPIIYCQKCGQTPLLVKDLPVELPNDVDFKPTGESPLSRSKSFHKIKCPKCGSSKALREPDTMDTFVCSSWYFLRYCDPQNEQKFCSREKIDYWCPVDVYIGGAEHAVMHLLYARFVTKVLRDQGLVNFSEPFIKLRNQGLILAEDGRKMSKSLGNVVNPDEVVKEYGADTLRMFEMFLGPLEEAKPWDTQSIKGIRRFLEKVWRLFQNQKSNLKNQKYKSKFKNNDLDVLLHKTIKKVGEDIEHFKFNTAISALMIFLNELYSQKDQLQVSSLKFKVLSFILLLSPFAPHLAEELWEELGYHKSIFKEKWPEYDANLIKDDLLTIIIQINGKARDQIEVDAESTEADIIKQVQKREKVLKWLVNRKIKKQIYVKNRLINFVV